MPVFFVCVAFEPLHSVFVHIRDKTRNEHILKLLGSITLLCHPRKWNKYCNRGSRIYILIIFWVRNILSIAHREVSRYEGDLRNGCNGYLCNRILSYIFDRIFLLRQILRILIDYYDVETDTLTRKTGGGLRWTQF